MKKPDRRKENRKKAAGALAGLGLAVFFFILLFGYGKSDPENPMENTTADASHMYLTSSTLAMDKEKLASVENANISSGGSENQAQQEEEQQEEEEQEETQEDNSQSEEEQQEDTQQQDNDQQQNTQETTNSSAGDSQVNVSDSLLSMIQKNQESTNGGSGSGANGGQGSEGDNMEVEIRVMRVEIKFLRTVDSRQL